MKAVILVGHGGVPKDFPRESVSRLRTLEAQREASKTPMTAEEMALDHEIRNWPRTKETDPYKFGVEEIAEHVQKKLGNLHLAIAYNEFCGPSIYEAADKLVADGFNEIHLVTTMFTRGGVHSEFEIPQIVDELNAKYQQIDFVYNWPFKPNDVADLLLSVISSPSSGAGNFG